MRLTVVVCGYFKKYVEREIAAATGYSIYKPLQGWRTVKRKKWVYDENMPWTDAAKEANLSIKGFQELVEPIPESEWKIFKGDKKSKAICYQTACRGLRTRYVRIMNQNVQILKGVDKGKQGVVCWIIKERNWCYVEGLNCFYRWVNKSSTNPGILTKVEKPLLVTTEVSLLDPSDLQPAGVEWRYDEGGNRVRVSLRSGRIIPMSIKALDEAEDYVNKTDYLEQIWDTKEKELTKVTFKPNSLSFEQDIMNSMGIKEDRKRATKFYY